MTYQNLMNMEDFEDQSVSSTFSFVALYCCLYR